MKRKRFVLYSKFYATQIFHIVTSYRIKKKTLSQSEFTVSNSPSMQVRSWATILRSISFEAISLLGVIASISSIKRIHGAFD